MQTGFQDIISATVRCAKDRNSLIWADQLAERIAEATPLPVNPALLADQLTTTAVREGVAVIVARDRTSRVAQRRRGGR